jgi:hypothetical protein
MMPTEGTTPELRDLKGSHVAALLLRRAADLSALASGLAIGGALASYVGWFGAGGVLIFLGCILHVLARAQAKRARSIAGLR